MPWTFISGRPELLKTSGGGLPTHSLLTGRGNLVYTVNDLIFALYIHSYISRTTLPTWKYYGMNKSWILGNRENKNNYILKAQIGFMSKCAKIKSAKIWMFTGTVGGGGEGEWGDARLSFAPAVVHLTIPGREEAPPSPRPLIYPLRRPHLLIYPPPPHHYTLPPSPHYYPIPPPPPPSPVWLGYICPNVSDSQLFIPWCLNFMGDECDRNDDKMYLCNLPWFGENDRRPKQSSD